MRLFAALELPETVRAEVELFARDLAPGLPKARWVRRENLHLTLIFLGEVEPARLPSLSKSFRGACGSCRPLSLAVRKGGTFPPRRPARVAWLGIEAAPADLASLQALVAGLSRAAAETVSFQPETRPYHPHLTVARPTEPWPLDAVEIFTTAAARPFGREFEVGSAALIESELRPGGAHYRRVESFAFGSEA